MRNLQKIIFTAAFLLCGRLAFSQNNMYILTERFSSNNNTTLDEVIVTDPSGTTTTHTIPHFIADPTGHDSQLATIINGITSQGYELVEMGALVHSDIYNTSQNISYRTLFFREL